MQKIISNIYCFKDATSKIYHAYQLQALFNHDKIIIKSG